MNPASAPSQSIDSAWISANAGSGKTTALVRRVMRLLLLGVIPERICCLTYTKAAAGEMRERIGRALRELLLLAEADCIAKLTEILERPPTAEELTRARHLFAMVLDSPSGGVQLTTIHGFCQQLLTRFPVEAGISQHFTVLEETEADLLKAEAQRRLLDLHGKEGPLAEALAHIVTHASEFRFNTLLEAITQQGRAWEAVWAGHAPESLREAYAALCDLPADATEEGLKTTALTTLIPPEAASILRGSLGEFLNHKTKTDQSLGAIFAAWLEADGAPHPDLLEALMEALLKVDHTPKPSAITKGWHGTPTGECLARIQHSCAELAAQLARAACMEDSLAMALLARSYREIYAQCKAERHALDYDDLIRLTRQLLSVHTGWVMTQLDHRIDHLMVDEAQDTSADQWEIARLLVEELIAYGQGIGSGNVPRSLLVVGDEKQSIFSFQGAAPERFAEAERDFADLLAQSPAPLVSQQLLTSYRSAAPVLQFVDAVANMDAIRPCLSASGAAQQHRLHHTALAGQVMLHPLITPPEAASPAPFCIPTDYAIAQRGEHLLAERVAAQLRGWMTHGMEIAGQCHPVRAGDVLILVRKRGRFMQSLIAALEAAQIPVAGLDRLKLNAHLAVRDLLAAMAWCAYPQDDLSLAHLLASPLIGLDDLALRALCVGRPASLWARITGEADHATLAATLEEIRRHASETPCDFLTHLLESMGGRQRFATRFGREVGEVLDELKAQAAAMPAHLPPTVRAFHGWISRSTREVKREQESGDANLVRLMTVHGSKGLEAPIVLMVDTTSTPTTQKEVLFPTHSPSGAPLLLAGLRDASKGAAPLIAAKEARKIKLYQEYARLFYVASTRPKQTLHLFGIRPHPSQQWRMKQSWYELAHTALSGMEGVSTEATEGAEKKEFGNQRLILERNDIREQLNAPPDEEHLLTQNPPSCSEPAWLHAPIPDHDPSLPILSPSRLVEAAPMQTLAGEAASAASQRGVRIHRVLQSLTAQSDAAEIHTLLAALSPDWDAETLAATTQEIARLHTQERWLWEHPSYPEVGICGTLEHEGRTHPITGQIDRLVDTPEGWVIVDYKTGRHIPREGDAVPDGYRAQMAAYRCLLQQRDPNKPVRAALIYTSAARLIWVDE